MDQAKTAAFLAELTELSRRHGLFISGCGCCGSPSVHGPHVHNGQTVVGDLAGAYAVDDSGDGLTWVEPVQSHVTGHP